MSLDPSALTPQRDAGIVVRVWRFITGATPSIGPQPQERDTSESGRVEATGSRRPAYVPAIRNRRAVYADADEMDTSAPEVSVALDTIADNATSSEDGQMASFDIKCEDAAALQVLTDTIERTGLHDKTYSLARNAVKYGDSFSEIVVNGDLDITDLRQLPPATMHRNQDAAGNLLMGTPQYQGETCMNETGECAFEQHDSTTDNLVAAFSPWQIVHTRLFHDGFSPYGRSQLRVTRLRWRQLKALEEGMIIGRLTRAYLKLVVYADGTGMSAPQSKQMLEELQNSLSQANPSVDQKREKPYSVLQDIYLKTGYVRPQGSSDTKPSLTKVDMIDPKNEGLQEIADVTYFHRQLLATLRVPPAYMGFEDQVNAKATVSNQDIEYVRFLRRIQQLLSVALKQVFDTALIIKGFDPQAVEYEIEWPPLNAEDDVASAQANFTQAQADAIYLDAAAIDKTWVQKHRFEMDDDDIAEIEEPEPAEPIQPFGQLPPDPNAAPVAKPTQAERVVPYIEALQVGQQRIMEKLERNGHQQPITTENKS